MSTPITYTASKITEDYAYTLKKYAISTGRPTVSGYTNYRSNPNSKTWYPVYRYNQYHPSATGYYVISNNRVQGGTATAGNEIPTFYVTGDTDNEILHLINRLPNRGSNFYTNIDLAKAAILADTESLHFDADLSKYNYYAPTYCILNFDAGNLNSNYKSNDNRMRDLIGLATDVNIVFNNPGSLNTSTDNSSFYCVVETGASTLQVGSGGSNLGVSSSEDYLVTMRIKIPSLINTTKILTTTSNEFSLEYDSGSSGLKLTSNGGNIIINSITTNFMTVGFGRDVANNTLFLYTHDTTNGFQSNTTTYTPNTVRFDQLIFGDNTNADNYNLGILQVWRGTSLIDHSNTIGKMNNVGQSDFFNQVHTMYSGRWS